MVASAARTVLSAAAAVLDRRSAPRLVLLFVGALLARRRRTVATGICAAGLSDEYRPCYTAVAAAGKKTALVAARRARGDSPARRRPTPAGARRR